MPHSPGSAQIRLHLGAHRTATTTVQAALDAAAPTLAQDGIAALVPWRAGKRDDYGIRSVSRLVEVAARSSQLRAWRKLRVARRELQELTPQDADVVIISDENFLGVPFEYSDVRDVYPLADPMLECLSSILWTAPERVHVTVRDYATFLPSAYAMSAIFRKGAPPFDSILNDFLALKSGWPEVLRAIRRHFPDSDISFARFESGPVEQTLEVLLGAQAAAESQANGTQHLNPAPAPASIDSAVNGRRVADRDQAMQPGLGSRFAPFTGQEMEMLSERYEQDLLAISDEFEEVQPQTEDMYAAQ